MQKTRKGKNLGKMAILFKFFSCRDTISLSLEKNIVKIVSNCSRTINDFKQLSEPMYWFLIIYLRKIHVQNEKKFGSSNF